VAERGQLARQGPVVTKRGAAIAAPPSFSPPSRCSVLVAALSRADRPRQLVGVEGRAHQRTRRDVADPQLPRALAQRGSDRGARTRSPEMVGRRPREYWPMVSRSQPCATRSRSV
jgi:hypothetical protein